MQEGNVKTHTNIGISKIVSSELLISFNNELGIDVLKTTKNYCFNE